jgi:hypothetical protein
MEERTTPFHDLSGELIFHVSVALNDATNGLRDSKILFSYAAIVSCREGRGGGRKDERERASED